jgi:hypothetical protein
MGQEAAKEITKGIYRVFFELGSTSLMVNAGPLIWKQLFNSGTLRLVREREEGRAKTYRLVVENFDDPAKEIFESFGGVIEGVLQQCKLNNLRVEIVTQQRFPEANCEYLVSGEE